MSIDEFTFHYVSIKSPSSSSPSFGGVVFTFHYVSIKSKIGCVNRYGRTEFTFHYVSIKSVGIVT